MSFVHGGSGFCVISSSVYKYICGVKVEDIIVGTDKIADPDAVGLVNDVREIIVRTDQENRHLISP